MATDVNALIALIDQAGQELVKNATDTTILFADLRGSTAFKIKHGQEAGLLKTHRHNDLIARLVKEAKPPGVVVKFIGDEAMARFDGPDGPDRAVNAALEIVKGFDEMNRRLNLVGDQALETRIGINSGTVYGFKLNGTDDPQGSPVDMAARIVSLASPSQILCTSGTLARCTNIPADTRISDAQPRELKGFSDGDVPIVAIAPAGTTITLDVEHADHFFPESAQLAGHLAQAFRAAGERNSARALEAYEAALREDPLNFVANLGAARIHLRQRRYVDAKRHAELARRSRPASAAARISFLISDWYHRDAANQQPADIAEVLRQTDEALALALADAEEVTVSMIVNFSLCMTLPGCAVGDAAGLAKVNAMTGIVRDFMETMEIRLVPGFKDTLAQALLAIGDEASLNEAEAFARAAMAADKNDPWPVDTLGKILKAKQRLANQGAY